MKCYNSHDNTQIHNQKAALSTIKLKHSEKMIPTTY